MKPQLTRRQFFRLGPMGWLESGAPAPTPAAEEPAESRLIRPPGAVDPERFLETCQRCRQCSAACEFDAIGHQGPEAGADEGAPVLDPNQQVCRWCPDMPCIEACPSGALVRLDDEPVEAIAKARLHLEHCLTSRGILCDDCAVACPSAVRAITMSDHRPVLDAAKCVGCGLCVLYCQAEPIAIEIVPLAPTEAEESS